MPLVVVFGGAGGTGLAAVQRCIALGHAVRAVVRSPEAHAGKLPSGVELVAGDVTDAASVGAALRGAHAVVYAASCSSFLAADAVDHQARRGRALQQPERARAEFLRRQQGVRCVAEAAKAAGVRRVALVSSAFVSPHQYWSPIRLILNTVKWRLMDAKFDVRAIPLARARVSSRRLFCNAGRAGAAALGRVVYRPPPGAPAGRRGRRRCVARRPRGPHVQRRRHRACGRRRCRRCGAVRRRG